MKDVPRLFQSKNRIERLIDGSGERCSRRIAGSIEKWVKKSREALGLFYVYAFYDVVTAVVHGAVIAQSEARLWNRNSSTDQFMYSRMTSAVVILFSVLS